MKVLVYGGTGSQGSAIVSRLLAQGHEPTVLTRGLNRAAVDKGARVIEGDLGDEASLRKASAGMDAVALTLSFTIHDEETAFRYARHAIDAAAASGVKLLVYNTSGPVLAERIGAPGYDVRPRIITYLQNAGVPYIVLKPTTYLENLLGPWTREGIANNDTLVYPVAAHQGIGWMATADLAALMVAALERPELASTAFVVSGAENVSGTDLAAYFSAALGRTIRYEALPLEAFGAALDSVMGHEASNNILPGYRILRDHPERVTNWTDMRPVLEKLPVQLTPVGEWVKLHAPMFMPEPVS